ncbi:hypothetical protein Hdeb2414_s0023g00625921 [Helianthus debilis subsp. tardiflorus]
MNDLSFEENSSSYEHQGSCQEGWKHGRLIGQKEARKRMRIRTLKVSDFWNHFLFINEVWYVVYREPCKNLRVRVSTKVSSYKLRLSLM